MENKLSGLREELGVQYNTIWELDGHSYRLEDSDLLFKWDTFEWSIVTDIEELWAILKNKDSIQTVLDYSEDTIAEHNLTEVVDGSIDLATWKYFCTSRLADGEPEESKACDTCPMSRLCRCIPKYWQISKDSKPRLCRLLGLDLDEVFYIEYPHCNDKGSYAIRDVCGEVKVRNVDTNQVMGSRKLFYMIQHPDCIIKGRRVRYTDDEVRLAKSIKTLYPKADSIVKVNNTICIYERDKCVGSVPIGAFDTPKERAVVSLDEILHQ